MLCIIGVLWERVLAASRQWDGNSCTSLFICVESNELKVFYSMRLLHITTYVVSIIANDLGILAYNMDRQLMSLEKEEGTTQNKYHTSSQRRRWRRKKK
jgi:hypothetical protein